MSTSLKRVGKTESGIELWEHNMETVPVRDTYVRIKAHDWYRMDAKTGNMLRVVNADVLGMFEHLRIKHIANAMGVKLDGSS